ncbi:uncharacterized protein LOC121005394 isoform X3 [Bufo bufo]|uniref:uncharacterized protein LOC121005394 isoform X3 n=1 Tax=Bufo bufo TaxID=8384 RepID=UPI001ABE01F5|nr:uncharacterized protein LOC121005394 isoform X3 [Bufo bufo]
MCGRSQAPGCAAGWVSGVHSLIVGQCPHEQGEDLIDIKVEVIEGEEEMCVVGDEQCKEEEIPVDTSPDGCSKGNPLERCPSPLYTCPDNNHNVPHDHQVCIKEEINEEEEALPVAMNYTNSN